MPSIFLLFIFAVIMLATKFHLKTTRGSEVLCCEESWYGHVVLSTSCISARYALPCAELREVVVRLPYRGTAVFIQRY